METNITKQNETCPATYRQLYVLRILTKKDWTFENLTSVEASEMITKLNMENGYVRDENKLSSSPAKIEKLLHSFLLDNIDQLKNGLVSETKNESLLVNDLDPTAQSYIFLGGGCGFVFIKYHKGNKKAYYTDMTARKLKRIIDDEVCKLFSDEIIKYLASVGNPIQAMQSQNYEYNTIYWGLVCEFLKKHNIKSHVIARYD